MSAASSLVAAGVDGGLLGGALLVTAVRVAVALAEARLRAGDWPLRRCGPPAIALPAHDVAVGLAGYWLVAVLPVRLLPLAGQGRAAVVVPLGLAVLSLALTGELLRRRRGLPLRMIGRRGALAQEPTLTVRGRLLTRLELTAARRSGRWITAQLDACRRRACATDEQLLPAVWAPARIRLRETVGVGRTEVALLLLQAQSVVDDASPPLERLLALLHLVHQRTGRRGVRSVLGQAARGPLRHGRPVVTVPTRAPSPEAPVPH